MRAVDLLYSIHVHIVEMCALHSMLRIVWAIPLLMMHLVTLNAQEQVYRIARITYHIEGFTRQDALEEFVPHLAIGNEYATRQQVEQFIAEQEQQLRNIRQLQSVEIAVSFHARATETAVHVDIYTVDTMNIAIFPQPFYDNITGLDLGIVLIDHNFLGTLRRFRLITTLIVPPDDVSRIEIAPSFSLPFRFLDRDWYWSTVLLARADFSTQGSAEFSFNNSIGVELSILDTLWTLSYMQGIFISNRNEGIAVDGAPVEGYYLTSGINFGTIINTGIDLGYAGLVRYSPLLYTQIKYRFDQPVDPMRRGVEVGANHALYVYNVDWIDNLREGIYMQLFNTNVYNIYQEALHNTLGIDMRGYAQFNGTIGISGRAGGILYVPYSDSRITSLPIGVLYLGGAVPYRSIGAYIRGVNDNALEGHGALFFNSDMIIGNFRNRGSLELQIGIFFDAVMTIDGNRSFDVNHNIRLGTGGGLLFFLADFRSFYGSLSFGIDPVYALRAGNLFGDDSGEIFFGFGHAY